MTTHESPAVTGDERGGAMMFLVVLMPVMFLFVGISWDVGNMLALKREADTIAASSARAGAQVVDQATLYIHTNDIDGRPGINTGPGPEGGEKRAVDLATAQGADNVSVSFDSIPGTGGTQADVISVTVERTYNPTFLKLLGITEVSMEGFSSARVRSAIEFDEFRNDQYVDQRSS